MEIFKEFSAKTAEEAIEIGLQEMGLRKEDATIVVLEEGKKKLFGYQKARVKIAPLSLLEGDEDEADNLPSQTEKDEELLKDGERAAVFVKGLFDVMGINAETKVEMKDHKVVINVIGEDGSQIIGKRGGVLDAVQTLAGAVANTGREEYTRIVVDCENYREKREETLQKLAHNLANKALKNERKIKLEAMNPYERRIIHAALSERKDVTTKSEGKEPNRYVVIVPENASDRPAMPAREEKRDFGGKRFRERGIIDKKGKPHSGHMRVDSRPRPAPQKKASFDFFGTFLGNSNDKKDL